MKKPADDAQQHCAAHHRSFFTLTAQHYQRPKFRLIRLFFTEQRLLTMKSLIIVTVVFIASASGSGGDNDGLADTANFALVAALTDNDSSSSQSSVKVIRSDRRVSRKVNNARKDISAEERRIILELLMVGLSVAGNHPK